MNLLSMAAGMMNIFGETMMSKMKRLLAILVLICLLMPISSSAMVRPRPYAIQAASFQSTSLQPQSDYTLVPVNVYRDSEAEFCRNDPVDFTDPLGLQDNDLVATLGDENYGRINTSGSYAEYNAGFRFSGSDSLDLYRANAGVEGAGAIKVYGAAGQAVVPRPDIPIALIPHFGAVAANPKSTVLESSLARVGIWSATVLAAAECIPVVGAVDRPMVRLLERIGLREAKATTEKVVVREAGVVVSKSTEQLEFSFARGASVQTPGVTAAGERFVRVGAKPKNLKFTFETPAGVQPGAYAFPEPTFNAVGNNPASLKDFGDLPGTAPQYYRILEPPAGTPIQRGIVPGGQNGGVGGIEEVIFPKGF